MMLYIHVPFCASHCSYCAFYSTTSNELLEEYYTTVVKEIEYSHVIHGRIEEDITSIFFGGGTPSFLPERYITQILETIDKCYSLSNDIEITIEGNPESITAKKATIWYKAGINRVSIGCQSFTEETLRLLQRIHSVETIHNAIAYVRYAGFTNISLDMIWGHCNHTKEQWLRELEHIYTLEIPHISCYALIIEENTLLAKQYELHAQFPSEEELHTMYIAGVEFLTKHGYIQYEISNFAKIGYQCRHNLGYWNNMLYYGYGPSASSYTGTARYTHPSSIKEWIHLITKHCDLKIPLTIIEYRDTKTAYIENLFLGLRQKKGIHIPTINQYLPHLFEEYYQEKIAYLLSQELITYQYPYLSVTVEGSIVLDSIIEGFLDIV